MDRKIVPPTLLIIGDVVKLHNKLEWFNPFHLEIKIFTYNLDFKILFN